MPFSQHLWFPSKYIGGSTRTRQSAEFQKMEMSLKLSKWNKVADLYKHPGLCFPLSNWLPEVAYIMSKPIKRWITSDWTLTSAPDMQFSALHAHLKLQSLPKVNRMTFGLLEVILVKTDMGWFLTTDRPQITIRKYYREANRGWPSHKHSTNLFLLSRTGSVLRHRYRPISSHPLYYLSVRYVKVAHWQMAMEGNW